MEKDVQVLSGFTGKGWKQMNELDEFLELSDGMLKSAKELLIAKNHDYAADDDVFKNIDTMAKIVELFDLDLTKPTHVVLFYMFEKMHRLINLERKDGVLNESVLDSVLDLMVFDMLYYGIWR